MMPLSRRVGYFVCGAGSTVAAAYALRLGPFAREEERGAVLLTVGGLGACVGGYAIV